MSVRPEIVLLVGAAGIGGLALLFPLLLRQNERPLSLPWPRLATALVAILLLFGLTRLQNYPFSPGGTLGDGLAIGGGVALLTLLLAPLWPNAAAATVGASGGALLGAVLILFWQRGYPNAALVGFGAGHTITTLLAGGDDRDERRAQPGLWAGPVVAALLAGALLLAIARAEEMRPAERLALDGKVWWIWPAVVLAIVLAGQMVALSVFARRPAGYLAAALVAALLLLLLWLRFPRYASLMAPLAAGFVTALFLLLATSGVQAFRRSGVEEYPSEHPNTQHSAPSALTALLAPALVLLLLAAAYRLYTGYGIAMAALGAAVLLPWLADREPRAVGRALFSLLAAAVLFRVYYNSYDLRANDIPLTAHYVLVGLLAGAFTPFALGAFQWSVEQRGDRNDPLSSTTSRLPSTLLMLLAAAALPCLFTLFWGQKAGGGLLLGLVLGQGFRMMTALMDAGAPGTTAAVAQRAPEAPPLVIGWICVQLLDRIATYGLQLLRVQRIGFIAAMVAICFLVILYRTWRSADARLV